MATLKYIRTIPTASDLSKATLKSAGFDLRTAYDYAIPPRGKQLIETGLKISLPNNCYGRIAPRSSLAWKYSIDVGGTIYLIFSLFNHNYVIAGVIDEDYRGTIKVILFNHSDEIFHVKIGDRIAQLICEKLEYPNVEEVEVCT